jgi:cell division septation protein DedD
VPETTRHGAEDGFHEIQLTGKQLVFLFMATTVVAVVIFLCGVLVGRGVRSDRPVDAADAAAAPVPSEGLPEPAPQTGEPSPASGESLSYAQRLQGEEPKEQLKPETGPESSAEPPTPRDAAPDEAPSATAKGSDPVGAATAAGDGWAVQVAALRDRNAAISIIRRLSSRGFPAFIVEPTPGAPAPGYRVRVGPYQEREEAERIARRLEREEQFKPFITR